MKSLFRGVLISVVLVLLGACSSYTPPKPLLLPKIKQSLVLKDVFSYKLDGGGDGNYLKLTPVLIGDNIFINSYSGKVADLNTRTGRKIWKIDTGLRFTSGLSGTDGRLFVGTNKAQLVAIMQSNGSPSWWAPVSNEVLATPLAFGKIVLVKDEDGNIRAFDATSGKSLWVYTHQTPEFILRGGSTPCVFGNRVVVGFDDGVLVALNLKNGNEIWRRTIAKPNPEAFSQVQQMVDIDVNPTIVQGVIYVATYQGNIAALRLSDGKLLWQHKLSAYSGLVVNNGRVFVSSADGYIWAFDAKSGKVIWKQNALLNRFITAPALIGNMIVLGGVEGYLYFISQSNGSLLAYVRAFKKPIIATPIVNNEDVYVYSAYGKLIKFSIANNV